VALKTHEPRAAAGITVAEGYAVAALAGFLTLVLGAYLLDLSGVPFSPWPMLAAALAAVVCTGVALGRAAVRTAGDPPALALVVGAMLAWLLWLAYPALPPLSTGPDLTHHLLLIRYIEEHWRLVHDPGLERFLGEMAQYTPGSHVVAALAGAWSGSDGLRALHPVQSLAVALKSGFLFLIGLRLLPSRAPRALALVGVLLLLASPRYFLGAFTEYGFVAQVVAELFVVSMWWAAVAWDASPDWRLCLVFSCAGAAAFLTWPVYTGPPALVFFLVIALREGMPVAARLRHMLASFVPMGAFALVYLIGRLGWLQLAGTGGAAPWPTIAAYGWPLVMLAVIGLTLAIVRRRGRSTALFIASTVAQTAAFYLLARRSGAPQPYMALKMFYLLLWPMAACAVMALGELSRVSQALFVSSSDTRHRVGQATTWLLVVAVLILVARPLVKTPRLLHPLPPAVSLPLYDAGRWARANLPPGCVEYLVGDDETAYWLHLAVLGNPRVSDRTGDNSTYEPNDAILRWLTPGGLPFAIADLSALPRDVRDDLDIVRRFDTAAVARRRGPSACADAR
jgi:hypothetical protein